MKKKRTALFLGLIAALLLGGCRSAGAGSSGEASAGDPSACMESAEAGAETDLLREAGADGDMQSAAGGNADEQAQSGEDTDEPSTEEEGTDVLAAEGEGTEIPADIAFDHTVVIRAHIKEVREDGTLLISSDSDGFPGAFLVEIEGIAQVSEQDLAGGTLVRVQMQDTGAQEGGLPLYVAKELLVLDESELAQKPPQEPDILRTDAPAVTLRDMLSSQYDPIELQPGNCSWNYAQGDEVVGFVACGAAPLDAEGAEQLLRVKVPVYNRLDEALYGFSCEVAPDTLTVHQWDAAKIGDRQAEETSVTTYYADPIFLGLAPGYVYELTAEWSQERLSDRGYFGRASYVFLTE